MNQIAHTEEFHKDTLASTRKSRYSSNVSEKITFVGVFNYSWQFELHELTYLQLFILVFFCLSLRTKRKNVLNESEDSNINIFLVLYTNNYKIIKIWSKITTVVVLSNFKIK